MSDDEFSLQLRGANQQQAPSDTTEHLQSTEESDQDQPPSGIVEDDQNASLPINPNFANAENFSCRTVENFAKAKNFSSHTMQNSANAKNFS